ncbi:MAG: hypothetical protein V3R57_05755 [Candidatus Bathyarchaeia archaeon]
MPGRAPPTLSRYGARTYSDFNKVKTAPIPKTAQIKNFCSKVGVQSPTVPTKQATIIKAKIQINMSTPNPKFL